MDSPEISIITPVFNEEAHLDDFFTSIRTQDVDSWEVVVVDDGSTDATLDIANRASMQEPRIRVVSPGRKLGKVTAFNRAFNTTRGKRVCHVGGDDTIPLGSLRERIEALPDPAVPAVAFGKIRFMTADGTPYGSAIPRGPYGSRSSGGATYTRALAEQIFPIPEALPAEDTWLGTAATGLSTDLVHIRSTLLNYRQHANNSHFRTRRFLSMSEALHAREEACRLLLASDLPFEPEFVSTLRTRVAMEEDRYAGRTWRILSRHDTSLPDRLGIAAMSHPTLWRVRQFLGSAASGWRGR